MNFIRTAVFALLLGAAAPLARAQGEPVLELKAGVLGADDRRLVRLRGETFTLSVRVRVSGETPDGVLLGRQTADRKSGFRLFLADQALRFEAAFDWKHPRNDRPLQLSVPRAALGAEAGHVVLVRFSGPVLELFVDGVLVDEEWPVGALAMATGEALTVRGEVEEGALWNEAVSDAEIVARSGGAEAVARRNAELLGPARPVRQYWKPRGLNTGVGDCMPFFHAGRFHLFYLIDRHGHASKWGLGAHQWAHLSTTDLRTWEEHPLAIPITEQMEGSICTGSAFASEDGALHGFYAVRTADGSPAQLHVSRSADGVHFTKTPWSQSLTAPYQGPPARDPLVFREPAAQLFHMLVTTELLHSPVARRGGCLAHLVSRDLATWEQREPFLVPGFTDQPECPDWFAWKGWHYLVFSNNGVARYRMSRSPLGPWLKPKVDVFDGPQARVLKTAAFTGDRRIGAAFLNRAGTGYAGNLLFRELGQREDGSLTTSFPAELQPAFGAKLGALAFEALTGGAEGDGARVQVRAPEGFASAALEKLPADFRLKLRVHADAKTAAFGICVRGSGRYEQGHELRFEPDREKVGWRNPDAGTISENENQAIQGVEGLDRAFELEVVVKGDILDVCVDGRRTLIARAAPARSGDRLFFFAQNGGATFESIEVQPLAETP